MIRTRFLRHSALEKLREAVPGNLDTYRTGEFSYLLIDNSLYFEGNFGVDIERLADLLSPSDGELHDVENCQACFASMFGLTPYDARDERLWAYITHTYMLEYARRRWPIPEDPATAVGHVRAHFFAKEQRQIERDNAASRLWWMARLCGRVKGLDLSESLPVFLYRTDVRASIIERPTVSQNLNLFSAIIRRLKASYSGHKRLFERDTFRRLMQEINSIGGVRLLDAMTESQIGDIIDSILYGRIGLSDL
jgi:Family of unknown function (DUF6339)